MVKFYTMFASFRPPTQTTQLPAIGVKAPQSNPSVLTKHIQSLPANITKKHYVYYCHNKDTLKTANRKKLSST